ncbi:hypothetical protein B7939_00425 [Eggerthia catenaformis]|nr:hypothetical protein B7939_00425 [Eggerthia catenaformis]
MYRKFKPSKRQSREFAERMNEIEKFCKENDIHQSKDSYYFSLNGKDYRVSNHTMEASNSHAYDEVGNQTRIKYHDQNDFDNLICITASKTRIIEIYNDLKAGYELTKRGYRK